MRSIATDVAAVDAGASLEALWPEIPRLSASIINDVTRGMYAYD